MRAGVRCKHPPANRRRSKGNAPARPSRSHTGPANRHLRPAWRGHLAGRGTARPPDLLGAAAAVVVALGVGAAVYAATSSTPTGTKPNATRTVALSAFDEGHASASATLTTGTIDLNATSLPRLSTKRYEVWLTNDRRTRMQPIGWVGDNGTAHLTVPADIMTQYNDLEVSVKSLDGTEYT